MGKSKDRRRARQLRTFAAVYQAHDKPAMRCLRYCIAFLLVIGILALILIPDREQVSLAAAAGLEASRSSNSGAASDAQCTRDGTCGSVGTTNAPVPFVVLVLSADGKIVVKRDSKLLPTSAMLAGETLAKAANRTAFPALRAELDFDAHCEWLDALPDTTSDGAAKLSLGVRCTLDAIPLQLQAGWELGSPAKSIASAPRSAAARFVSSVL